MDVKDFHESRNKVERIVANERTQRPFTYPTSFLFPSLVVGLTFAYRICANAITAFPYILYLGRVKGP